jgi:hypothetical protein
MLGMVAEVGTDVEGSHGAYVWDGCSMSRRRVSLGVMALLLALVTLPAALGVSGAQNGRPPRRPLARLQRHQLGELSRKRQGKSDLAHRFRHLS